MSRRSKSNVDRIRAEIPPENEVQNLDPTDENMSAGSDIENANPQNDLSQQQEANGILSQRSNPPNQVTTRSQLQNS